MMIFLLMSHDLRDLKKVLFGQLLPKATTFKIHSTIQTENQATPSQSSSSKVMWRALFMKQNLMFWAGWAV